MTNNQVNGHATIEEKVKDNLPEPSSENWQGYFGIKLKLLFSDSLISWYLGVLCQ